MKYKRITKDKILSLRLPTGWDVALREIAAGFLSIENLEKSIITKSLANETKKIQSESANKTFDEINEEVLAEIESLKESPDSQSEQLFKNEEDIQE